MYVLINNSFCTCFNKWDAKATMTHIKHVKCIWGYATSIVQSISIKLEKCHELDQKSDIKIHIDFNFVFIKEI